MQTRLGSFVEGVLFLVTACIGVSGGTSLGRGYDKLSTDFGLLGVATGARYLTVWA